MGSFLLKVTLSLLAVLESSKHVSGAAIGYNGGHDKRGNNDDDYGSTVFETVLETQTMGNEPKSSLGFGLDQLGAMLSQGVESASGNDGAIATPLAFSGSSSNSNAASGDDESCTDCEESQKVLEEVLQELQELRSRIAECTDGFSGSRATGVVQQAQSLLTMIQPLPSTLKSVVNGEMTGTGGIGLLGATGLSLAVPNGASSTVITVHESQKATRKFFFSFCFTSILLLTSIYRKW